MARGCRPRACRPGFVRRVTQYEIEGSTLRFWGVDKYGNQGADRFHGMVLAMEITSPMPDVVRVRAVHHQPTTQGTTSFDLDYSLAAEGVTIEDQERELVYRTGKLTVRVKKGPPWDISFECDGKRITGTGADGPAYMSVPRARARAATTCCSGSRPGRGRVHLRHGRTLRAADEERPDASRSGISTAARCPIRPTRTSRSISPAAAMACWSTRPAKVEFEVATERVSQIQFSRPRRGTGLLLLLRPDAQGSLREVHAPGRPAGPAAGMVLWPVALDLVHHAL